MNYNDIYSHLAKGGDSQALFDAFLKDVNEAQAKVEAEKEAKKKAAAEAAKKAAAEKEAKEKKEVARKAAISATLQYLALVFPNKPAEQLEIFAKASVDATVQNIKMIDNVKVSKEGNTVKMEVKGGVVGFPDWLNLL